MKLFLLLTLGVFGQAAPPGEAASRPDADVQAADDDDEDDDTPAFDNTPTPAEDEAPTVDLAATPDAPGGAVEPMPQAAPGPGDVAPVVEGVPECCQMDCCVMMGLRHECEAKGQCHLRENSGPLLPNLQWPGFQIWEIRERNSILYENNEYLLDLKARFDPNNGQPIPMISIYPSMEFVGHFWTLHSRVAIRQNGQRLFYLRRTKAGINPLQLRDSFRIVQYDEHCTLGWCGADKVLFTINKDWFGRGLLWMKEEWRVYRGRKRHQDPIYYAIGSYFEAEYNIWHTQQEKAAGQQPLGQLVQDMNGAWVTQQFSDASQLNGFLNNNFKLMISGNEDAGLLTTLAAVIDIVHDVRARAAAERRRREQERRHSRRSGGMRRRRHRRHHRHHSFVETAEEGLNTNQAGRYRRSPSKGRLSLEEKTAEPEPQDPAEDPEDDEDEGDDDDEEEEEDE
mmetsp:Transcript_62843/g.168670  ORF Transcript_62843/g.168670 Transcript_62843/m.168670 type:complete len:453 (+) Transcript_62843:73-1431(+)